MKTYAFNPKRTPKVKKTVNFLTDPLVVICAVMANIINLTGPNDWLLRVAKHLVWLILRIKN